MIHPYVRRGVILTVGVVAIAGAATAMHVDQWTPMQAFLERGKSLFGHPDDATGASAPVGLSASIGRRDAAAYNPSAEGPGGFATGTAGKLSPGKALDGGFGPDGLQGGVASGNGADVSLTSLWRLMGLARHHTADVEPVITTSHSSTTPRPPTAPREPHAPRTPSPGAPPASTPHPPTIVTPPAASPTPGVIAHAPTPSPSPSITAPPILIGKNPPSVSGLIGGGSTTTSGGGSFGSGGTTGSGGGGGVTGGGFSATPEPAAIVLLGTGLLGLVEVLRRRRV